MLKLYAIVILVVFFHNIIPIYAGSNYSCLTAISSFTNSPQLWLEERARLTARNQRSFDLLAQEILHSGVTRDQVLSSFQAVRRKPTHARRQSIPHSSGFSRKPAAPRQDSLQRSSIFTTEDGTRHTHSSGMEICA